MLPEFDSLESGLVVEIVRKQLKQSRGGQSSQEHYSHSECSYNPSAQTPQFYPSLESDFKAFLEDLGLQFADILLQIGPKSFPAHKCILAARCKYFEAMFRSFMPTDAKVNITFGQVGSYVSLQRCGWIGIIIHIQYIIHMGIHKLVILE